MKLKLNQLSYYYLFPICLFILGIFNLITYIKSSEFGILNLDLQGNSDQIIATQSGELLKGDKVWGKFHSQFTNLGILSVRFFNEDRDSKDTLVFRIKEVGAEKWYYEAKYETDQFLPHKQFPFGFPTIGSSDQKDYEFELESLRGATGSGILVDKDNPVFIAKSTYSKTDIVNNNNLRKYFFSRKLINIFSDYDLLYNLSLCFLPFSLYLIFLVSKGISYQYLTLFSIILPIFDIFVVEKNYDLFLISVLFLWGLIHFRYHFSFAISTVFATTFFFLTAILLFLSQIIPAEKAATWGYLYLLFSIILYIWEIINTDIKTFSLKSFINKFPIFVVPGNFWMRKIPTYFLNILDWIVSVLMFPLSLISLEIESRLRTKTVNYILKLISISPIVILLIIPVRNSIRVFSKFIPFFPSDYFIRYLFTIILPLVTLFVLMTLLFRQFPKVIRKSKFVIFVILLIFNFLSGKIISNAINFEKKPTIFSISPNKIDEAWTDVVINGKNFRDIPFLGKLYLGGKEQGEYMIHWSDEKIIFRTSPELSQSGFIQVIPLDRQPSNKVYLEYNFKY